jgi:5'-phosphate synthase pdxT subunit
MVFVVGVLAIQGAVEEHMDMIKEVGCVAKEIRNPQDIEGVDGIILPGGESTAMSIICEENGVFAALRSYVQNKKPIWGTCAGMILLSDHAFNKAKCGQSLVGGLDVHVCRNYFGSQIHSCVLPVTVSEGVFAKDDDKPFSAVLIRAPAILKVGNDVTVLGSLRAKPHVSAVPEVESLLSLPPLPPTEAGAEGPGPREIEVYVAVQQGNILATAFHPELTRDLRWHRYFVGIIERTNGTAALCDFNKLTLE